MSVQPVKQVCAELVDCCAVGAVMDVRLAIVSDARKPIREGVSLEGPEADGVVAGLGPDLSRLGVVVGVGVCNCGLMDDVCVLWECCYFEGGCVGV